MAIESEHGIPGGGRLAAPGRGRPASACAGSAPAATGFQQEAGTPHWIWHPSRSRDAFVPGRDPLLPQELPGQGALAPGAGRHGGQRVRALPGRQAGGRGRRLGHHAARRGEARAGPHVLAARATNEAPGPAGLLSAAACCRWGRGCPSRPTPPGGPPTRRPRGTPGRGSTSTTGAGPGRSTWGRSARHPGAGWPPCQGPAERFRVPEGFAIETVARPR